MRYPAHVAVGDHPDVLHRIHERGINLAIWERRLAPELARSVASVAAYMPKVIPWFSQPVVPHPAARAWNEFLATLPSELRHEDAAALVVDMHDSTRLFRGIVQPEQLTLSWRAERRDRKWGLDWHHDALRFRLLCFYYGATTRGLANRHTIKLPGNGTGYRKRLFARSWGIPLGALALFKGLHDEHDGDHPFVHSEPAYSDLRLLNVITD